MLANKLIGNFDFNYIVIYSINTLAKCNWTWLIILDFNVGDQWVWFMLKVSTTQILWPKLKVRTLNLYFSITQKQNSLEKYIVHKWKLHVTIWTCFEHQWDKMNQRCYFRKGLHVLLPNFLFSYKWFFNNFFCKFL